MVSLEQARRLRILVSLGEYFWGSAMRRTVVAAAIFAAASLQGASAADRHCYSAVDLEAEQAIRFQTNLMVISSACRDTVYGEFGRATRPRSFATRKS